MTPPDQFEPADAFEQRLAATPHRELPAAWRARILASARAAEREPWQHRLAALLWPHPLAWGALASGWLAIAALNLSGPRGEALYAVTSPASRSSADTNPAEMLAAMCEQHRLIELWIDHPAIEPQPEFLLDRRKL